MKNIILLTLTAIIILSCSKDETSSTTTSGSSSTTTTTSNTFVKLNVIDTEENAIPGLVIMMFKSQVTSENELPKIEKQVVSDANGLAYFDLNDFITSSTPITYYFEAFKPINNGFIWESITHPKYDLSKGKMITSSIIVN